MRTVFHQAMEKFFPVTLVVPHKAATDFIQFLNRPEQITPFGSSFCESPTFKPDNTRYLFLSDCSAQRLRMQFGADEVDRFVAVREVAE
ncbi:hypothetical protein [Nocardia phage P3.1]|nr:hypothetical protein [Nocardia phage P3.1]